MKSFIFITSLAFSSAMGYCQDTLKAVGQKTHPSGNYLHVVNGLKLTSMKNLVAMDNSYRNTEVKKIDTLTKQAGTTVYGSLMYNSDGVIEITLSLPFVLDGKLLLTDEEKIKNLSTVNDADIVTIKYQTRSKTRKLIGRKLESGSVFIQTK